MISDDSDKEEEHLIPSRRYLKEDGDDDDYTSSPVPSIPSSFERMNLLDSETDYESDHYSVNSHN